MEMGERCGICQCFISRIEHVFRSSRWFYVMLVPIFFIGDFYTWRIWNGGGGEGWDAAALAVF